MLKSNRIQALIDQCDLGALFEDIDAQHCDQVIVRMTDDGYWRPIQYLNEAETSDQEFYDLMDKYSDRYPNAMIDAVGVWELMGSYEEEMVDMYGWAQFNEFVTRIS